MKALTLKNDSNDLNQIFANINPFLTSKNPSKKLHRIKHGNHSRALSVGREKGANLNNLNESKESLFLNASKIENQSANVNNEEFSNFENNFEILQNECFFELNNISPDESFKEKPEFKILTASEKEKRNFSNGKEIMNKLEEHICKNEILKHKIKDLTEKYIIDLSKKEKEINELKGYRDYYLNLNRKYELITKKKKNELILEKDQLYIENLLKENNLLKLENLRINEENRVINTKLQYTEKQLILNKENVDFLKKEKDEFIKKIKYLIIKLKNVEKENGFLQKKQNENKTLITSLQKEISHHISAITQMTQQNRKIEEIDEIATLEDKNSPENIIQKIKPHSNKHFSFTFNKGTERNYSANKRISLDHSKKADSNFLITKERLKPEKKTIYSFEIKKEKENLKISSESIKKEINECNLIEKNGEENKEKNAPSDIDKKITSKKSITSKNSSTILKNVGNDSNIKNIIEKINDNIIMNNENPSVNDEIHNSRNCIIFQKKTTLPEIKAKNEMAIDNIEGHVENNNMAREESLNGELQNFNESTKHIKNHSQLSVRSLKNSKNLEKMITPTQRKESYDIISNLTSNAINIDREKKHDENTNDSQNWEKIFSKQSIQSVRSQKGRENRKSQNLENETYQEIKIEEKKEEKINLTLKEKKKTDDMMIINNDKKLEEKVEITEKIEQSANFSEKEKENKTQEVLNDIIIKKQEHLNDKVPLKEECLARSSSENNPDDKKLDDISSELNFADSTKRNALEKQNLAVDLESDVSFYIQSLTKNSISLYPFYSIPCNRDNGDENIKTTPKNSFEKEKKADRKLYENTIGEELNNAQLDEIEVRNLNVQDVEIPDLEEDLNRSYKKKSDNDENDFKATENKKIRDNDQEKQQKGQNGEKINNKNEQEKAKEEKENKYSQQLIKENLKNKNEMEIAGFKYKKNIIENELIKANENAIEEFIIKDDFSNFIPDNVESDLKNIVNHTINKKDSISSEKKCFLAYSEVHSEHNEIVDLNPNEKLKNSFEKKEEEIEKEKQTQSKESEQNCKFEYKNLINDQSQIDEIKTQKASEKNLKKKHFVNYQDVAEALQKDHQNEFDDKNIDQELIKKSNQTCKERLEENNLIFCSDINFESPNKIQEKKKISILEEKHDFDLQATSNENFHQSTEAKQTIEAILEKNLSSKTNIVQKIVHSLDQINNNMERKFEAIEESALLIKNNDFFKDKNEHIEKVLQTEENEEELDLKPENIESPRNEKITCSIEKQKKEKKELMSSNIKSKGKVNTRYEKGNENEKIKTTKFLLITDIPDSKTFCKKICDEMDFKFIIFAERLKTENIWQELKNDLLSEGNPPYFFFLEIVNNEDIGPMKFFSEFKYDYFFCIRREDSSYKNAFEELEKYFCLENKVIINDLNDFEAFKNTISDILKKLEK